MNVIEKKLLELKELNINDPFYTLGFVNKIQSKRHIKSLLKNQKKRQRLGIDNTV